jgi:alkylation response protein AidB-like acyl-CoA dehydrogenase
MTDDMEPLDDFRQRARTWIQANLPRVEGPAPHLLGDMDDEHELAYIARNRELQRMLFDGGLAGVIFPKEYGGQGLTPAHQQVLNEEISGHEYPFRLQIPTFVPCAAVIHEFGTDEQKREHLPKILKGEEIWIQLLSEPTGGSDVAGAITTAIRDGEEWVLNGSKVWSSGAWWSDWGLCLARTNWDVPKHRGLSVFMFPLDAKGVEIRRIEQLNGSREFCEEFFTDVRVPDSQRLGEVDQGWTVGTSWMMHERMSFNSPFITAPKGTSHGPGGTSMAAAARQAGRTDDPRAVDLVGEARVLDVVGDHLSRRLGVGLQSAALHPQGGSIGRLWAGMAAIRRMTIAFELAGEAGGVWKDQGPADPVGVRFLQRQGACIGGGTTEIARNVIAERVLGMPRELTPDRGDTAFRDVPKGKAR